MSDLEQRLREKANDLYKTDGDAMKMWDQIRHILKPRYGGTLPREMFESFIEGIADLLIEAAEQIPARDLDAERSPEALQWRHIRRTGL